MPDVDDNRAVWDGSYAWSDAGLEWSASWGSAEAQWHATLLPRLRSFLPADRVLEIAPGFGRWSEYLIPLCRQYTAVDISASAVEACTRRFGSASHARFFVNDGRSLEVVEDGSIDLAFSFDSLVHVEDDVIGAYLSELKAKLAPDGVGFIHHSNLGEYRRAVRMRRMLTRLKGPFKRRQPIGWMHWRGLSMTAHRFDELARSAGLVCVGQESINWLGPRLIDCISVVARPQSTWDRGNVLICNPHFMSEAASTACVSYVYGEPRKPRRESPTEVTGAIRHFGSSRHVLATKQLGPYGVSLLGPWPGRRRSQK